VNHGPALQRAIRLALKLLARLAARALLRLCLNGVDNIPLSGAVLFTMNHLGGADPVLVLGFAPRDLDIVGKSEIMRWPIFNWLARAYGMLPVRRGEPDRATLNAALRVLQSGRALLIAPEGRESHSGALEEAKGGAAFIALHSGAPIVPVAITGTAWARVVPAWRRLRRPCVTLTFGRPYTFSPGTQRREAADQMMLRIAALLPPEYRGVYAEATQRMTSGE
jgi:1-acyl-sn-glycerol-3-phosphate acyltransferase